MRPIDRSDDDEPIFIEVCGLRIHVPIVVINLPERKDRLAKMKSVWPSAIIQEGIRAKMPHTGCALAHIQAIRKGFLSSPVCLILEDDLELLVPKHQFLDTIKEVAKEFYKFDVAVVSPNYDDLQGSQVNAAFQCKRVHESNWFQAEPTFHLLSTHCCVWSKRSLPLLERYEQMLLTERVFLPIDRFVFTNVWDPSIAFTFETCISDTFDSDAEMPGRVEWTMPTTWFNPSQIVQQASNETSDHTNQPNIVFVNKHLLLEHCIRATSN